MLFFQKALAMSPSTPLALGAAGSGRGPGHMAEAVRVASQREVGGVSQEGCSGCSPLLGAGHEERGQEGSMEGLGGVWGW